MKINWHSKEVLLLFGGALLALLAIFPFRAWSMAQAETYPAVENITIGQDAAFEIPTNQIIIKYQETGIKGADVSPTSADQLQRLSEAAGVEVTYLREMSGNAHVLRLPDRYSLDQVRTMTENMMKLPEVEYAEPDAIMFHTLTPNDPQYTNQWHYFAPTSSNYGINAPAAWDITTGSASIVVAVIDTGITNHAEFSGRTVAGYDFINDSLVANDGNGRDSNPSDPGDWITAEESASGYFAGCPVSNSSWHGTHTAGTIGAASNNGVGVTGINWNSKILPVRVLGKCGGYTSDIVDGSRWAAGLSVSGVPANSNPAKVLNLSLGGSGACDTTWQNAINEIVGAGTTVVVSAGNNNANASGYSPASCNNVITVAATNKYGNKATYSNYGSVVDISAPGGNLSGGIDPGVLSTLNTGTQGPVADTYAYYQGTSMAAPHVAGVVSLLYSLNPSLTPAQILSILQSSVTNFPTGSTCNTSICGSGIVNAGAAVSSVSGIATPTPTRTRTANPNPTSGVFMPLVRRDKSPTPTPTNTPIPQANVYIDNGTGGSLCFEVYNTGIGQKCSSSSYFFYGSFPPGTYTFHASAWCGSLNDTLYYPAGDIEQSFWCNASANVDTLSSSSQPVEP